MAISNTSDNGLLGVLCMMDNEEVFRVIDKAIAVAAWQWPEELVARRDGVVQALYRPPVDHALDLCFGGDGTELEETKAENPNLHPQKKRGIIKLKLKLPSTARPEAPRTPETVGPRVSEVAVPSTTDHHHQANCVGKGTGVLFNKANRSRNYLGEELRGVNQERPKINGDFSEAKLEALAMKMRERYQECQGSRKRSRLLAFEDAPKPEVRVPFRV